MVFFSSLPFPTGTAVFQKMENAVIFI